MEKLDLNFLGEAGVSKEMNPIEEILHEYGAEICKYAKGYFYYIVTTSYHYDVVDEASLYLIVPEIGYDYKVLTIAYTYKDTGAVTIQYFTLETKQAETHEESIVQGLDAVRNKVRQLLSSPLANSTFKFLIDQVNLKRENKEDE